MATYEFRALRTIAMLLKLVAWISLVAGLAAGGLLIGLGGAPGGSLAQTLEELSTGTPSGGAAGVAGGIAMIFMSVIYFLFLLAAGEGIRLLLAVEGHTRESANLMREMWTTFGPPPRRTERTSEPAEL